MKTFILIILSSLLAFSASSQSLSKPMTKMELKSQLLASDTFEPQVSIHQTKEGGIPAGLLIGVGAVLAIVGASDSGSNFGTYMFAGGLGLFTTGVVIAINNSKGYE
ncbi:MAG: hypothetical protein AAF193_10515 [Bacteroidota bacterium]